MTVKDLREELKHWRMTKYKVINFTIAILSLLIYEFIGRPVYRTFIYSNNLNDFHIADTLGNTFGTVTTLFFLVGIFSNDKIKGNYLIKVGTISVVVYELAQPLLGKPIDPWDIVATVLTGGISLLAYNLIFQERQDTA